MAEKVVYKEKWDEVKEKDGVQTSGLAWPWRMRVGLCAPEEELVFARRDISLLLLFWEGKRDSSVQKQLGV